MFDAAFENADKNFPVKLVHIIDKILSTQYPFLSDNTLLEMRDDISKGEKICLYVCKNENVPSAAGFLYSSVISTLQPGDYIITSSTEECLINKHNDFEAEELLELASEVNQKEFVTDDIFYQTMYMSMWEMTSL